MLPSLIRAAFRAKYTHRDSDSISVGDARPLHRRLAILVDKNTTTILAPHCFLVGMLGRNRHAPSDLCASIVHLSKFSTHLADPCGCCRGGIFWFRLRPSFARSYREKKETRMIRPSTVSAQGKQGCLRCGSGSQCAWDELECCAGGS